MLNVIFLNLHCVSFSYVNLKTPKKNMFFNSFCMDIINVLMGNLSSWGSLIELDSRLLFIHCHYFFGKKY